MHLIEQIHIRIRLSTNIHRGVELSAEHPTWDEVEKHFRNHPKRLLVAQTMVKNGISVRDDSLYANEIKVPFTSIAKAANVDRRSVIITIEEIKRIPSLKFFFKYLRSEVTPRESGLFSGPGIVEISVANASQAGILAKITSEIARSGISIRYLVAQTSEFNPSPPLIFQPASSIPKQLLETIGKIEGVVSVTTYRKFKNET